MRCTRTFVQEKIDRHVAQKIEVTVRRSFLIVPELKYLYVNLFKEIKIKIF